MLLLQETGIDPLGQLRRRLERPLKGLLKRAVGQPQGQGIDRFDGRQGGALFGL